MKTLLLCLGLLIAFVANSQELLTYTDTINKFSIGIPEGWQYGINKDYPSLKLIVKRSPGDSADIPRENYNINIINVKSPDLESSFKKLAVYLASAENYQLHDSGTVVIHNNTFKWLIESHKNELSGDAMHNYVFLYHKDNTSYILTLVTFSVFFEKYRDLFERIARSFDID